MDKFIMLFAFLLLLSGCVSTEKSDEKQETGQVVKVKNTQAPNSVNSEAGKRAASHLEKLATSVPKVNGATAVVLGRYALVGIDLDANVERSEAGVIKYSVAEALKEDPYGARAMVVADPDINARLKEISSDIKAGKPVQGILYELADITGRIMPEVPGKITQPDSNSQTEKEKPSLSPNEKRKLEQKQEKQSNFRK